MKDIKFSSAARQAKKKMAQSVLKDVSETGAFNRPASVYISKIEAGGKYPPAGAGRYVLFVSYACPWASRCIVFRRA